MPVAIPPYGPEILLNPDTPSAETPVLAAFANGRFVSVRTDWSGAFGDGSWSAIVARWVNPDGSLKGADKLVNSSTLRGQEGPAVAVNGADRLLVTFTDINKATAPDAWSIRGQIFSGTGKPIGDEVRINKAIGPQHWDSDPVALANGGFAVAYTGYMDGSAASDGSGNWVGGRLLTDAGKRTGGDLPLNDTTTGNQYAADTARLSDGRWVAVWEDQSGETGLTGATIRGQIFNEDGSRSGNELVLPANPALARYSPAVAALAEGRFAVVYHTRTPDVGDTAVHTIELTVFEANGTIGGDAVVVSGPGASRPAVAVLPDGRILVAWINSSSGTPGVQVALFSAAGLPLVGPVTVNTAQIDAGATPSIAVLADGRVAVGYGGAGVDVGKVFAQILDPRDTGVTVKGTAQADSYIGSAHADDFALRGGNDVVKSGAGDDEVAGGTGRDKLSGEEGNDTLRGDDGNDRLLGGDGNDTINGGRGDDILKGNDGDDTLNGAVGDDVVLGGDGNDTIDGGTGDDKLAGGDGDDVINGGTGDDVLDGGDGADYLDGGIGNNRFIGGLGQDQHMAGPGHDVFVFRAVEESLPGPVNHDVIEGFKRGADRIDLSEIDARTGGGNQEFNFIGGRNFSGEKGELRVERQPGGVMVQADVNGDGAADMEIFVVGLARLGADDFDL